MRRCRFAPRHRGEALVFGQRRSKERPSSPPSTLALTQSLSQPASQLVSQSASDPSPLLSALSIAFSRSLFTSLRSRCLQTRRRTGRGGTTELRKLPYSNPVVPPPPTIPPLPPPCSPSITSPSASFLLLLPPFSPSPRPIGGEERKAPPMISRPANQRRSCEFKYASAIGTFDLQRLDAHWPAIYRRVYICGP